MGLTPKRVDPAPIDRRRLPRLVAPVIYWTAGLDLLHHPRRSVDVSAGGMRVLSDELLEPHDRLELDLLPPGDPPIRLWAKVTWIKRLHEGVAATYEVGLQFIDVADADRQRLASLLVRAVNGEPVWVQAACGSVSQCRRRPPDGLSVGQIRGSLPSGGPELCSLRTVGGQNSVP